MTSLSKGSTTWRRFSWPERSPPPKATRNIGTSQLGNLPSPSNVSVARCLTLSSLLEPCHTRSFSATTNFCWVSDFSSAFLSLPAGGKQHAHAEQPRTRLSRIRETLQQRRHKITQTPYETRPSLRDCRSRFCCRRILHLQSHLLDNFKWPNLPCHRLRGRTRIVRASDPGLSSRFD